MSVGSYIQICITPSIYLIAWYPDGRGCSGHEGLCSPVHSGIFSSDRMMSMMDSIGCMSRQMHTFKIQQSSSMLSEVNKHG